MQSIVNRVHALEAESNPELLVIGEQQGGGKTSQACSLVGILSREVFFAI